jgi:hypothetical protein
MLEEIVKYRANAYVTVSVGLFIFFHEGRMALAVDGGAEPDATASDATGEHREASPPSIQNDQLKQAITEAVAAAMARRLVEPRRTPPSQAAIPEPDRFVESNVISLVGRDGFRWQDRAGQFLLNPYVLVQTRAQFQYFDDAGLDLSDPDNLANLGFAIPNAIFGVAGKAFGRLSFNLALNGPCGGGCLMNEAWLEGNFSDAARVRVGKFKTPMSWHVQSRLGARLAPGSPTSLATRVNTPFDINALNPTIGTNFDVGVMLHGRLAHGLQYQIGLWNGEGVQVNGATSTLSDDSRMPALMGAARLAWQPLGPLAPEEGGAGARGKTRVHVGASTSYNVEANAESSSDLRAGIELVVMGHGWTWANEGYLMNMRFTERMRGTPSLLFYGAYTALSRYLASDLEPFVRWDIFERNSTRTPGILLLPGIGCNYYMFGPNLKLQAFYQYAATVGHSNSAVATDDVADLGRHTAILQLQFAI